MDIAKLNHDFDKVKSAVFLGKDAAFLGSILCSMEFVWDELVETACTDSINLLWNPNWYMSLPIATRKTVLMHELWHPARLHHIRCGSRDHKIWNWACDIVINNNLEDEGYTFDGTDPWKDQQYRGWMEEDVYDDLIAKGAEPEDSSWGVGASGGDMLPVKAEDNNKLIQKVIAAVHVAKMSGTAGTIPGNVEDVIKAYLTPIVPWEGLLYEFMSDLGGTTYSFRRPNRRYEHIYMPSRIKDDGRLRHVMYFLDVSGSITRSQILRFNSEVAYIKDTYNPEKLTLVTFDVVIRGVFEIDEEDDFEELVVVGRGGTDLDCVRHYIDKHQPTAVIIFSDLDVSPMAELKYPIPVLWVCIGNPRAKVPFGKLIHIRG